MTVCRKTSKLLSRNASKKLAMNWAGTKQMYQRTSEEGMKNVAGNQAKRTESCMK